MYIEANKRANRFHHSISCLPEPMPGASPSVYFQGREGQSSGRRPRKAGCRSAQLSMLLEEEKAADQKLGDIAQTVNASAGDGLNADSRSLREKPARS